jgi:predicted DsbA family dithiol-disulfide isomerase
MLEHLTNVAGSLGLPFGKRTKTYNSRLAQELGLWVEEMGKGHDFHMAAFHAYFANGKNLAEHNVLLEIVDQVGLDRSKAEEVLHTRSFSPAVDEHWKLSREKGVTAVPTFIMNNISLTGARPYKDLVDFIKKTAS